MNVIPIELEKLKTEIDRSMEIYAVIQEFKYVFTDEENKRKWNVFGGPKDILRTIDEQKVILEKEKIKFNDKLDGEQENLRSDMQKMDMSIASFHTNRDIKLHAHIASVATGMWDGL